MEDDRPKNYIDVRSIEAKRMVVVKKRWRCMLNVSCEKKYCSMTYSVIRV